MLNNNKKLMLDIGNVLFTFHLDKVLQKLLDLKLFKSRKLALLFLKQIESQINLGYVTTHDAVAFYDGGKRETLYREFSKFWSSSEVLVPNNEILDWLGLHWQNTYIVSNIGVEHYSFVKKSHKLFQKNILGDCSFKTGYLKPHYSFFTKIASEINGPVLYVDDKVENLKAFEETYQWRSLQQENKNFQKIVLFEFDSTKNDQKVLIEQMEKFICKPKKETSYFSLGDKEWIKTDRRQSQLPSPEGGVFPLRRNDDETKK